MGLWQWLLDSTGLLLVVIGLLMVTVVVRRRWLARQGAVFKLSVNTRRVTSGRGWTLGLGLYSDDHLEWFRAFSLSWRPRRRFRRSGLRVLGQRSPQGVEAFSLYSGHVILDCTTDSGPGPAGVEHPIPDRVVGVVGVRAPGSRGQNGRLKDQPAEPFSWCSPPGRHNTSPRSRLA